MKLSFRGLATLSALMYFILALVWLLASNLLLSDWGVEFNSAAGLVGRRASALYAGLGVMFLAARNAEPSVARSALSRGVVGSCLALAALGIFELGAGHATPRILLPSPLRLRSPWHSCMWGACSRSVRSLANCQC